MKSGRPHRRAGADAVGNRVLKLDPHGNAVTMAYIGISRADGPVLPGSAGTIATSTTWPATAPWMEHATGLDTSTYGSGGPWP